jgi:hypothetical protein
MTVAKLLVSDWGDIVDSGIGLSTVVPARQATHTSGPVRQSRCRSRQYPTVRD